MTTAPTPLHQDCADFATSLRSASIVAMATNGAAPPSFLRAADLFECAAAELLRLQAENERLQQLLQCDTPRYCSSVQRCTAGDEHRAELEARKPLPLSYRSGVMTSSIDGGATVSLHFNDMAEAEAWFVAITDQHDAALVDKSPNLQEPLVDKTANLQDQPASLIASREVIADGPVRVTRLHLSAEGRAALTTTATGPLSGITRGSS